MVLGLAEVINKTLLWAFLRAMVDKIQLKQGAGGQYMDAFIKNSVLPSFTYKGSDDISLEMLDDAALINDVAMSTDAHTVQPLIFPGGTLGSLSVCGTINDISMVGATPLALAAAFIIEEGLSKDTFSTIVKSMGETAHQAQVPIITGDTKVVERGAIQEFMITTTGVGKRHSALDENFKEVKRYRSCKHHWLVDGNVAPGDQLIVSGNIGEHGIALLSFREGYGFHTKIQSDIAALHTLMDTIIQEKGVVTAKDPTRGGVANTLNEFSEKSGHGILIYQDQLPIPKGVQAACDMLGIDPLEIGNEGKVILSVVKEKADEVLAAMKKHPLGKQAAIIGQVTDDIKGVAMETSVGGKRIIHKPLGDPVPRIC